MLKSLILVGFSAAALVATPALAQTPGEARAIPVRYADLDLSQTGDADALLSRIRYAAFMACERVEVNQPTPAARRAVERCKTQAVAMAVATINEPELTRLYQATRR